MILKCTCAHAAQDWLHGPGKRVHNAAKDPNGGIKWRCTICLKEKSEREIKK